MNTRSAGPSNVHLRGVMFSLAIRTKSEAATSPKAARRSCARSVAGAWNRGRLPADATYSVAERVSSSWAPVHGTVLLVPGALGTLGTQAAHQAAQNPGGALLGGFFLDVTAPLEAARETPRRPSPFLGFGSQAAAALVDTSPRLPGGFPRPIPLV